MMAGESTNIQRLLRLAEDLEAENANLRRAVKAFMGHYPPTQWDVDHYRSDAKLPVEGSWLRTHSTELADVLSLLVEEE